MPFRVDSEVGRLRKVIVHRPGLEQRRLTPQTAAELLFDDVIWVRRAEEEHAAFVALLRERGVEVFDAADLLLGVLEDAAGRAWLLDQVLQEREVGQYLARSGRAWAAGAEPRAIADFLIGGMAKEDVVDGGGLFYGSSEPTDMVLPPLPNAPDLLVLATELAGIGGTELPLEVSAIDSFPSVTDAPVRTLSIIARIPVSLAGIYRNEEELCGVLDRCRDISLYLVERSPVWLDELD